MAPQTMTAMRRLIRFTRYIDFEATPDCWIWTGAKRGRGYGVLKVSGKCVSAHRYAYEHAVGPIPKGLTLDHLCRNAACINWKHLEAVTQRENVLRGEGPTAKHARKVTCSEGHAYVVMTKSGERGCKLCKVAKGRELRRQKREAGGAFAR